MKYSVSNVEIYARFKGESYCALCDVKQSVNKGLIQSYLNEAVMEDHVRAKVNKLGFCKYHFDKLYEGESKLSLALQIHTRLNTLIKTMGEIDNVKQAKKQIEEIEKATCSCIICETVDSQMVRYEETIACMFSQEEEFRTILENEKSICIPHYVNLLKQCSKAGKYADAYVKALNNLQRKSSNLLSCDLSKFCSMFDYRNKGKQMGEEKLCLPKSRIKLYGRN